METINGSTPSHDGFKASRVTSLVNNLEKKNSHLDPNDCLIGKESLRSSQLPDLWHLTDDSQLLVIVWLRSVRHSVRLTVFVCVCACVSSDPSQKPLILAFLSEDWLTNHHLLVSYRWELHPGFNFDKNMKPLQACRQMRLQCGQLFSALLLLFLCFPSHLLLNILINL